MKHLFLSFILFFFAVLTSQAQVFKPAVGVNFTDFSKDAGSGEFKSQVGWQIGGSLAFGKKIYLEPGIFYLKKSTEYQTSGGSSSNTDFDISGIRIPVAVGINLLGSEKSTVGLRAFGGGSAFILTSVKDLDKDDFESASWGVFAGAGLDFTMFFLDIQYEWSLTNVTKDINTIDVGKTRSLFLNAGIRITL
jgi:hypothetical protein